MTIILLLFAAFFAAALLFGGSGKSGTRSSVSLTAWTGGGDAGSGDAGPESISISASGGQVSVQTEEPEEETAEETVDETGEDGEDSEYILPDSDSTYISEDVIAALTEEELRLARNEIYARHGRIFKDETLAAYFESKSWYVPLYDAETFDALGDSILNEYEIANRDLIKEYEALYAEG